MSEQHEEGTVTNINPAADKRSQEEVHEAYYAPAERAGAIENLQKQIQNAKDHIEMEAAFKRLENNPDFVKVVEQGYVELTRDRCVRSLGNKLTKDVREDLQNILMGVGCFQQHLTGLMQHANVAKLQLPQMEDELFRIQSLN